MRRVELPACWYVKSYTPEELAAYSAEAHAGGYHIYLPPFPATSEMHLGETDGAFYSPVCSGTYWLDDRVTAWIDSHIDSWYVWVVDGGRPPVVLEPREVADSAWALMKLPELTMGLSPNASAGAESFVSLPTWLWVDDPRWTTGVPITATVGGLSVTVTARPRLLLVDPGTSAGRADLHTGAGGSHDGRSGCPSTRPYTGADADAVPPCGVTYRHSTADVGGSYQIATSVVWDATWTENGAPRGPVAGDATLVIDNAPIPVTVHEVQTTVTSAG